MNKKINKLESVSKLNGECIQMEKSKIKIKLKNNLRDPKVCKKDIL